MRWWGNLFHSSNQTIMRTEKKDQCNNSFLKSNTARNWLIWCICSVDFVIPFHYFLLAGEGRSRPTRKWGESDRESSIMLARQLFGEDQHSAVLLFLFGNNAQRATVVNVSSFGNEQNSTSDCWLFGRRPHSTHVMGNSHTWFICSSSTLPQFIFINQDSNFTLFD